MTPEQEQSLQAHIQAIAKILYDDTAAEDLTSLSKIEQTVRQQMQRHVMPKVGIFLSQQSQTRQKATDGDSKASLENSPSPRRKPKN